MVRVARLAAALSILIGLVGCLSGSPRDPEQRRASDLDELLTRMTGSFSSAEQHAADSENYLDIRLEMVRIWPERTDGRWIYVEQAVASALDRPYRQRVYRVTVRPDHTFESAVFTIADPAKVVGAWRDSTPLADMSPTDLTCKEGCSMILRRQEDGAFVGGTEGNGCSSDLRGASFATSEARILPDRMITWDRGFDSAGKQVWGATKGGYIFIKQPATN